MPQIPMAYCTAPFELRAKLRADFDILGKCALLGSILGLSKKRRRVLRTVPPSISDRGPATGPPPSSCADKSARLAKSRISISFRSIFDLKAWERGSADCPIYD